MTTQDNGDETVVRGESTSSPPLADSFGGYTAEQRPSSEIDIGSILNNTYEVVGKLGGGGMGSVYKAFNIVLRDRGVKHEDTYVAIKVLKSEYSADKDLIDALALEFTRTQRLSRRCENIIKLNSFENDGPNYYIVMEHIIGRTLSDYIDREPHTLKQTWWIIAGISNALNHAHQSDIVHRDIKPGNIMLTEDGEVKVLDFGIASKVNQIEDATIINSNTLAGYSLFYASPETLREHDAHPKDDIYAFACVIYEILTGERFYDQKVSQADPINALSKRQMSALNKALSPERTNRTESIDDLLIGLQPANIPWIKYTAIAAGVFTVLGVVAWFIFVPSEVPEPPIEVSSLVHEPIFVVDTPPIQPPIPEKTPEPEINKSKSSDGIVALEATKANYSVNEVFTLNFTLTQKEYAVLIIRGSDGIAQIIRPSAPYQNEVLFEADTTYTYPPKEDIRNLSKYQLGDNTVTVIASSEPLVSKIPQNKNYDKEVNKFMNKDGSIKDSVKNNPAYSYAQIQFRVTE